MSNNINRRPEADECNDYFKRYINQVEGSDILGILREGKDSFSNYLKQIPAEKWDYSYAENKWTLKESLIHLIDAERVFAYRAMRVARNDQTPLPGFEQDDYVPYYNATNRSSKSVIEEYESVRAGTITLFESLEEEAFGFRGTASNGPITPLAVAFIIAGHQNHHQTLIEERYL